MNAVVIPYVRVKQLSWKSTSLKEKATQLKKHQITEHKLKMANKKEKLDYSHEAKINSKYLQEKQARLLWECCSSCGVTSVHCLHTVSRAGALLLLLLFTPAPRVAIMALTEATCTPQITIPD